MIRLPSMRLVGGLVFLRDHEGCALVAKSTTKLVLVEPVAVEVLVSLKATCEPGTKLEVRVWYNRVRVTTRLTRLTRLNGSIPSQPA